MIQGIYLASQGMTMLLQKQDQIANNLANIHTTGFKQSGLFAKSYEKYVSNDQLQPFANREIKADEVYVDYSQGHLRQTNQPFDIAIHGSGFFKIMSKDGIGYSRNGNFAVDHEGFIVTSEGNKVLGKDGFIQIERDLPVQITDKGEVLQGKESKGVISVVDFKRPYEMQRIGDSRFKPIQPDNIETKSPGYSLKQGYLEGSNVDMIKNMVQMISTYRNFEADQKALQAQDETLDKSVNQVSRVS